MVGQEGFAPPRPGLQPGALLAELLRPLNSRAGHRGSRARRIPTVMVRASPLREARDPASPDTGCTDRPSYLAGSHDERLFPGVPDSYTVPIRAHEERRQRSARRPSARKRPCTS